MESKIIRANDNDFIVHFNNIGTPEHNMRWEGGATEIEMYDGGGWEYRSNESSQPVNDIKDARVWFEWSFVWRGVWEGRIYFKDDEYWSSEMKTISELWNQIEVIIKEKIKSDNPNYKHFDN